jgi:hypothetical protein
MSRKYLEEIGIKLEDTPWGWNKGDSREKYWMEEIHEDGFDERETWDLNFTMNLLLYERLCKYKEMARGIVNLSFYTFEYNGKELTQEECIDKIFEGLRLELTLDPFDKKRKEQEVIDKIESVWKIYDLIKYALWW